MPKEKMEEQSAAHSQGDSRNEPTRTDEADAPSPEQGTANNAEGREPPLTRIGPYKLLKRIGEGVAGIVFQAEQQEPVRLMVALKLIKEGLDWRQIITRFEAERQCAHAAGPSQPRQAAGRRHPAIGTALLRHGMG